MSLLKLNRVGVMAIGATLALSCISIVAASDQVKPVTCNHSKPCLTVTNGTGSAVVGNGGASAAAVAGNSAASTFAAVSGTNSSSGAGVSGSSVNGDGVSATSSNSTALFAGSVATGVFAETSGGFGDAAVEAIDEGAFSPSNFDYGVLTEVSGTSPGLLSFGGFGDGADIYGGENGGGVFTENFSSVPAIQADGFGASGIVGESFSPVSYAAQFINETEGSGSVFGPALFVGNAINGSFMTVDGNGNVNASGTITGGVVAVRHITTDNKQVVSYAAESSRRTIEDFGSGRVVAGSSVVHLDPSFAKTLNMSAGYHVYITPNGDNRGVYVEKGNNSFVVREAQGGHSTFSFDYRIVGSPADAHQGRLASYAKPVAPAGFSNQGAAKAKTFGMAKYNKAKADGQRMRTEGKRQMQMAALNRVLSH